MKLSRAKEGQALQWILEHLLAFACNLLVNFSIVISFAVVLRGGEGGGRGGVPLCTMHKSS